MDWTQIIVTLITVAGGASTAWLVAGRLSTNDRSLERDRWKRETYAHLLAETGTMAGGRGLVDIGRDDRVEAMVMAALLVDEVGMIASDAMLLAALDLIGVAEKQLRSDIGPPPAKTMHESAPTPYDHARASFRENAFIDLAES